MIDAVYHFPPGFLWGCAVSPYQTEGNNPNSTWVSFEQEPGRVAQPCGLATDWWSGGRWKEDFNRAAEGDQNAFRMGVEWSRVQPAPDSWDEHALDKYRAMAQQLVEYGIKPMVALHHFSDPIWLAEEGGWENEKVVQQFAAYCRKVADALKAYVGLWLTINEPNVYIVSGYLGGGGAAGVFPPAKNNLGAAFRVGYHMLRAHAAAYRAIDEVQPEARVSMAIHYRDMQPLKPWLPLDQWVTRLQVHAFNDAIPEAVSTGVYRSFAGRRAVPEARGTLDFYGLNYYTGHQVRFNLLKPKSFFGEGRYRKGVETSEGGFLALEPDGFWRALKWVRRFKLPVMITELGVNDRQDDLRRRFLALHLRQLWRAANASWGMEGFFHWTLVDNWEWERGWTQRFGLWELDPETQARRKRPSADFYAAICRENGLSAAMVRQWAPETFDLLFPSG